MNTTSTFDQVLTTIELLPLDEQAELVAVVQRRLAELGRRRVIDEVRQGIIDYQNGLATEVDPKRFLDELSQ